MKKKEMGNWIRTRDEGRGRDGRLKEEMKDRTGRSYKLLFSIHFVFQVGKGVDPDLFIFLI